MPELLHTVPTTHREAAGSAPQPAKTTSAPDSVEAASALLRDGRAERVTVRFAGAGTKADWGAVPDQADLDLSTAGLAELISYHPGDMTASVGAGMQLARLQPLLAEHGQFLALDPASEAAGATIGGLMATGDAGPRRLRHGTMRDLAIGATLVLSDGTVVHTGSHVIKNVAGYDLAKLFFGSLGSLGLIAEVILRLHPRPAATGTLAGQATLAQARAASAELRTSGMEPAAVEWFGSLTGPAVGSLLIRADGSRAGVTAGLTRAARLLQTLGIAAHELEGADDEQQWTRSAQMGLGVPGSSVARAGTRPDRLVKSAEALMAAADSEGVDATLVCSTALGLHTAVLSGAPAAQAATLTRWRTAVEHLGGTLTLRQRPAAVAAAVDAYGKTPSSIAYLRAVKQQLDPENRCGPGRFRGWY